jgi:hypothetical protein
MNGKEDLAAPARLVRTELNGIQYGPLQRPCGRPKSPALVRQTCTRAHGFHALVRFDGESSYGG